MQASSTIRRVGFAIAGLSLCVGLASCGGSDDGSPPTVAPVASNTPPASASADVAGFIAYLKILVMTQPDNTQPLDLTGFVAPTSDTTPFDPTI